MKLTYVYELPVGQGKRYLSNGVAGAIVGGWRISGIQSYASGLPMNIGTNAPSFHIGEFSNTPHDHHLPRLDPSLLGQVPAFPGELSAAADFLPDAVVNLVRQFHPATTRISAVGLNLTKSLGVSRIFSIKERAHLEVRGEAFNVLNRTWFGPLGGATTLGNANWGKWQAQANSPRQMQLAAKLTW